jgi:hypothetical protein
MSIAQSIYVALLIIGTVIFFANWLLGKYSNSEYARVVRDAQLYTAGSVYLKYGRVLHGLLGTSAIMISVFILLILGWNVAAVLTLIFSGTILGFEIYMVAKVSKDRKTLRSVQAFGIWA